MSDSFMENEVRVYCPVCKDGKNAIWHGTLLDWGIELATHVDNKPPTWYLYAMNHQRAHKHRILVKYPDKTVPLDLGGGIP